MDFEGLRDKRRVVVFNETKKQTQKGTPVQKLSREGITCFVLLVTAHNCATVTTVKKSSYIYIYIYD